MIVLIINGCTSSSSGTLWINSLVNLPGWITCTESGRKYFQSLLDCDNSRTDPRGTPDGPPDRSLDRPNWIDWWMKAISQYATMPLYYADIAQVRAIFCWCDNLCKSFHWAWTGTTPFGMYQYIRYIHICFWRLISTSRWQFWINIPPRWQLFYRYLWYLSGSYFMHIFGV